MLPENSSVAVEGLALALGLSLDDVFVVEPCGEVASFKYSFPTPTSVRDALTKYLDIQVDYIACFYLLC